MQLQNFSKKSVIYRKPVR